MTPLSPVFIALTAVTVASFGAFAYFSVLLHLAKGNSPTWRGIIKLVALGGMPEKLVAVYPRWFAAFWAFYAAGCIYVAWLSWGTDHSFLVVIFPLLFYYFFARYFLWEKADLTD